MFSRFFIDRPIFAWVIAIFIVLAGVLSLRKMPVAPYPQVAQPSIAFNITYPGASAEVIEQTVTALIEQEMNGADGLLYMESVSQGGNGQATITVTFKAGTDPALAQVDVQNRLKRVEARLPSQVTQQGVQVDKARANFLLFATLASAYFLRERVGGARWTALIVGFLGVLIVTHPGTGTFQIGALFALGNAILYGTVTAGVRGMSGTESTDTLMMYQMTLLTLTFGCMLPLGVKLPVHAIDAVWMVSLGLANVIAVIPLTPGGLGIVEGVLIPTLVGFGVTKGVATAGVLSYRIAAFWLPIPLGAVSYLTVRRDRTAANLRQTARAAYATTESRFDWAEEYGHRPRAERPKPDDD